MCLADMFLPHVTTTPSRSPRRRPRRRALIARDDGSRGSAVLRLSLTARPTRLVLSVNVDFRLLLWVHASIPLYYCQSAVTSPIVRPQ